MLKSIPKKTGPGGELREGNCSEHLLDKKLVLMLGLAFPSSDELLLMGAQVLLPE